MRDITHTEVDDVLRKPIELLHARRDHEYITMTFIPLDNIYTINYGGKRNGKFWKRDLGFMDKNVAIVTANILMRDHVKLSEDMFQEQDVE